ncbi:hypothetical protein ScPMuIL_011860 [Solemya velum]
MAARTCLGSAVRLFSRNFGSKNAPTITKAGLETISLQTNQDSLSGASRLNSTACTWARKFSTVRKVQKTQESDTTDLIQLVNEKLHKDNVGRLFAVVHVAGKQRKITTEDIIVVEGDFFPDVGDRIRLEKVLLVGGSDFTLTGRPMLSRDLVKVEATVVEKTLSNFKVTFTYIRRKGHRKFNLRRNPQTVLVINSIELNKLSS